MISQGTTHGCFYLELRTATFSFIVTEKIYKVPWIGILKDTAVTKTWVARAVWFIVNPRITKPSSFCIQQLPFMQERNVTGRRTSTVCNFIVNIFFNFLPINLWQFVRELRRYWYTLGHKANVIYDFGSWTRKLEIHYLKWKCSYFVNYRLFLLINTLRTGDADLRLYITTVQDGWCKSAFLTRAWFPRTIHLITQYMEHFSEWSCWWMFIRGLEL